MFSLQNDSVGVENLSVGGPYAELPWLEPCVCYQRHGNLYLWCYPPIYIIITVYTYYNYMFTIL